MSTYLPRYINKNLLPPKHQEYSKSDHHLLGIPLVLVLGVLGHCLQHSVAFAKRCLLRKENISNLLKNNLNHPFPSLFPPLTSAIVKNSISIILRIHLIRVIRDVLSTKQTRVAFNVREGNSAGEVVLLHHIVTSEVIPADRGEEGGGEEGGRG